MNAYRQSVKDMLENFDSTEKRLIDDVLCEIDEYNRNSICDAEAIDVFNALKLSSWDVVSGYTAYCEDNFGGVECYQGEKGVVPYKSLCLWFDTLLYQNVDCIFENREKAYSERQIAKKIKRFLLNKDNLEMIKQHNYGY